MRKFLAVVLALVMVCSLGVAAFAAGSETASTPTAAAPVYYYGPAVKTVATVSGLEAADVEMVDIAEADTLAAEDKAAFEEAYEAVKAMDGTVLAFFWVDAPTTVSFTCNGTNVKVLVNGAAAAVSANGTSYTATIAERGAVAIVCD